MTWTSYNKPSQITSNGTTATFTYGRSRERLMTTVPNATGTVTTTYIDGLFEQVTDSATGNITYKHYILAGSARVGVESVQANSGGTVTADTLSFYVHDEVGSVVATAVEGLGGVNQTLAVYSYDAWGKARTASGTSAYASPSAGSFLPDAQIMAGQQEGYAGHEDIEDIGLVNMEGRVYDPEVGRFLSPDPNVQYPDSSQGYDRYTYVGDNPLSLSDPSGYFAGNPVLGAAAAIAITWACEGTCGGAMASAFMAGAAQGYISSGGNLQATGLSAFEAEAFALSGSGFGPNPEGSVLLERSALEGITGGVFNEARGGRFSDGFVAAFVGSELGGLIGNIGDSPNKNPDYYNPAYESARVAVSAIVGGTVSELTGGKFSDGALAAAMQRLYNDDHEFQLPGGATAKEVQEAAESQQASQAGVDVAIENSDEFTNAYFKEFEGNQQAPRLQEHDPVRSVADLALFVMREEVFKGYEHGGKTLLKDGDSFGHVNIAIGRLGSFSFGVIESAAFGLDAGDAIYSFGSASWATGINPFNSWLYIASQGH